MYFDEMTSEENRIVRAKYDDFYFENIDADNFSAVTVGRTGKYNTSLNFCTCQDFQKRRKPCKHIYRLSYKLGKFNLYDNIEQEEIAIKINKITDLITAEKLKDIYYRKRDYGEHYCIGKDLQTDFLEKIGLIKMYDIPIVEIIDNTYKVSELKEILKNKYDVKGLKKQDLITLFANDEELIKILPSSDKYKVDLLIAKGNNDYFIECLNYRIYNQLQSNYQFKDGSDNFNNYNNSNKDKIETKLKPKTSKVNYQPELSIECQKLMHTGQKYILFAFISMILSIFYILFLLPALVLMIIALVFFTRAAIRQYKDNNSKNFSKR